MTNCKDSHTTYFPELHAGEEKWTKEELEEVAEDYNREQKEKRIEYQVEKYERLSEYSLDPENKKQYDLRARLLKKHMFYKTGNMSLEEYADYKRYVASFNATSPERVVELLRKDAEAWIEGLSEAQKQSIRKYSFNPGDAKPNRFFERLNTLLRDGEIDKNPSLKEHADRISEGIAEFKLTHNVIAYRRDSFDISSGSPTGSYFRIKQFVSSSVRRGGALKGVFEFVLYVKSGSRAAYIEGLSHFPDQRELLIDKDALFKVLSRQGNLIELEVIA
nr:MAG TPA: VIP2 [Caudoviricetes sp.]